MHINNIRDERIQKSTVEIVFSLAGYNYDLDKIVDSIVDDLKTSLGKRDFPTNLTITVNLK